MVKMSIIIPIYNTEKYLRRCINSIIKQSLEEIEIICVDDCSDDASLSLLEELASEDIRIKIITNKTKCGPGIARNVGIEMAVGEYIFFLDSDDYIEADFLEDIYNTAHKNKLDVIRYGYKLKRTDTYVVESIPGHDISIDRTVKTGKKLFVRLAKEKFVHGELSTLCVSKMLLSENSIYFPEGVLHEDALFTFEVMMAAQRAMYLGVGKYIYEKRKESITTDKSESNLYKKAYGLSIVIDKIYSYLLKVKDNELGYAIIYYIDFLISYYVRYMSEIDDDLSMLDNKNDTMEMLNSFLPERSISRKVMRDNLERIKAAHSVVLYGAGGKGKELLELLNLWNVVVDMVVVTDVAKSRTALCGHRVRSISELEDKKSLVLVAISKASGGEEAIELLERQGYMNVINCCLD